MSQILLNIKRARLCIGEFNYSRANIPLFAMRMFSFSSGSEALIYLNELCFEDLSQIRSKYRWSAFLIQIGVLILGYS